MNFIFTDGLIYPMDRPGVSPHRSLLVRDGRIALLGTLADCRAAAGQAEVIDLRGKALLPAFTDTHTHFVELGKFRLQLNLAGCATLADVRERITKFRQEHPQPPAWILGGGWDINRLDQPAAVTKDLLDKFFPDLPVALYSKDYHSRWCNSLALKLAGIGAETPDPPGGKIQRDVSGQATGILSEAASDALEKFIQPPSVAEVEAAVMASLPEIHRLGLAGVHSMEPEANARILERVAQRDKTLRVCWHFPLDRLEGMLSEGRSSYSGDEWFRLGGVKIFADGALGSRTAAVFHPYPDSSGNLGILRHSAEELQAIGSQAASGGIALTVHAIGTRAVQTVIDTVLRLNQSFPGLPHRIEHLQSILPEDLPRLKRSGAYCALQPIHLANDVDLIERHWAPIRDCAYVFRSVLDTGIPIGFGSDAPIESINPFLGIYSAIARKKGLDQTAESWQPTQSITAWEALRAYTLGAARGSLSQDSTGSLTPGKLADLTVLDDFSQAPAEFWLSAQARLTLVGGNIVWRDGA